MTSQSLCKGRTQRSDLGLLRQIVSDTRIAWIKVTMDMECQSYINQKYEFRPEFCSLGKISCCFHFRKSIMEVSLNRVFQLSNLQVQIIVHQCIFLHPTGSLVIFSKDLCFNLFIPLEFTIAYHGS